jgi:hypothetical protein
VDFLWTAAPHLGTNGGLRHFPYAASPRPAAKPRPAAPGPVETVSTLCKLVDVGRRHRGAVRGSLTCAAGRVDHRTHPTHRSLGDYVDRDGELDVGVELHRYGVRTQGLDGLTQHQLAAVDAHICLRLDG